jgi:hypothetical protein
MLSPRAVMHFEACFDVVPWGKYHGTVVACRDRTAQNAIFFL